MSFAHPLLLLTLLVVPVAGLAYLLVERRPARYAMTFTNLDVLASVAGGRSWLRYVPLLFILLALTALSFAVARPHRRVLVPSEGSTVVLVLDVSGSMEATDVKPTRLAAAQSAAEKFLERVPPRVRVAVIAFAGEPQLAAPPTTDRTVVREAIDSLGDFSGFGGTAIGDALAAAVHVLRPNATTGARTIAAVTAAPRRQSGDSILFLSDGHQTRGDLEPLQGAAIAKRAGIPVNTIALGTPNGMLNRPPGFGGGGQGLGGSGFSIPVPPDPVTLRAIAKLTGGKFFNARTAGSLHAAYSSLGAAAGRKPGRREVTYEFLGLGAILLVAAGIASALVAPRLP
jgi:Ca-activated chloride channel family protein